MGSQPWCGCCAEQPASGGPPGGMPRVRRRCVRVLGVGALCAALAMVGGSARADVKVVKLGVNGLTRATPATLSLRKRFRRLGGVDRIRVFIRPPHVEVRMEPGTWPDLARMQRAIREAGYAPVPDRIELTVTGRLSRQAAGYRVELDGMRISPILPVRGANDAEEVASRLERHVGELVELTGRWQPGPAGTAPGTLLLADLSPASGAGTR